MKLISFIVLVLLFLNLYEKAQTNKSRLQNVRSGVSEISQNITAKQASDVQVREGLLNTAAHNEIRMASSKSVFIGKVSYYSAAGCLGCSVHRDESGNIYFKTASGDIFNESKMALAFNRLPLGTRVRVTNLDNGQSRVASVNDTGGFERLGRLADLTKGLAEAIGAQTDKSRVKIEEL